MVIGGYEPPYTEPSYCWECRLSVKLAGSDPSYMQQSYKSLYRGQFVLGLSLLFLMLSYFYMFLSEFVDVC